MTRCEFCNEIIDNPRKDQRFCSGAHRAAAWREQGIPRCPNCDAAISMRVRLLDADEVGAPFIEDRSAQSPRNYPVRPRPDGRLEHCIVWEDSIGPVPPGWLLHHINGDRSDYRLDNLMVCRTSDHAWMHRRLRRGLGPPDGLRARLIGEALLEANATSTNSNMATKVHGRGVRGG